MIPVPRWQSIAPPVASEYPREIALPPHVTEVRSSVAADLDTPVFPWMQPAVWMAFAVFVLSACTGSTAVTDRAPAIPATITVRLIGFMAQLLGLRTAIHR